MNKDGGDEECLIHFRGEIGPITHFSEVSFEKFLKCRKIWLSLDGEQRNVANKTVDLVPDDDINKADNFAYHRSCYSKFTNKTLILRAENRCRKNAGNDKDVSTSGVEGEPCQPKILRSSLTQDANVKPRNQHVLPPVCIICQKQKLYYTNQVSTCTISYHMFM
jgi:predicted membrane chloride channel (bestrophin family)